MQFPAMLRHTCTLSVSKQVWGHHWNLKSWWLFSSVQWKVFTFHFLVNFLKVLNNFSCCFFFIFKMMKIKFVILVIARLFLVYKYMYIVYIEHMNWKVMKVFELRIKTYNTYFALWKITQTMFPSEGLYERSTCIRAI